MSEHRARVMTALKSRFVPALRERGFIGAFPHFREHETQFDGHKAPAP